MRIMKGIGPLVILAAVLIASTSGAQEASSPLIGAWRAISVDWRTKDGAVTPLYGEAVSGLLVYDASGKMSGHLMNLQTPKCGTLDRRKCPDIPAREAFSNYLGTWGRYEISADMKFVLHHIEGSSHPDLVGVSQKRYFEVQGNRLVITTPTQTINGVESVVIVVWERVSPR